jgi:hypothetical protein
MVSNPFPEPDDKAAWGAIWLCYIKKKILFKQCTFLLHSLSVFFFFLLSSLSVFITSFILWLTLKCSGLVTYCEAGLEFVALVGRGYGYPKVGQGLPLSHQKHVLIHSGARGGERSPRWDTHTVTPLVGEGSTVDFLLLCLCAAAPGEIHSWPLYYCSCWLASSTDKLVPPTAQGLSAP